MGREGGFCSNLTPPNISQPSYTPRGIRDKLGPVPFVTPLYKNGVSLFLAQSESSTRAFFVHACTKSARVHIMRACFAQACIKHARVHMHKCTKTNACTSCICKDSRAYERVHIHASQKAHVCIYVHACICHANKVIFSK